MKYNKLNRCTIKYYIDIPLNLINNADNDDIYTMNIIRIFILNAIISKIDNNILKYYSIKTAPCYKDNDIAHRYISR